MTNFPKKNWLGSPKGWQKLGEAAYTFDHFNSLGEAIVSYETHEFCSSRLHIGKENGKVFKYCPRCEIKSNEELA